MRISLATFLDVFLALLSRPMTMMFHWWPISLAMILPQLAYVAYSFPQEPIARRRLAYLLVLPCGWILMAAWAAYFAYDPDALNRGAGLYAWKLWPVYGTPVALLLIAIVAFV